MAPIAAVAPAGSQSATLSATDSLLRRGKSLRRASTMHRPRHQQQLPTQRHAEEDEDAATSFHSNLQAHRRRGRQSYQVAPRQQMLHLPDSQRPASSRSHTRGWDHQRARSRSPSYSRKLPLPDNSSQQTHAESCSSSSLLPSSGSMTSEEFEALPPAVQRKYFSTLERLRFAQSTCAGHSDQSQGGLSHSASTLASEEDVCLPGSRFELGLDRSTSGTHHQQSRARPKSAFLYPSQVDNTYGRLFDSGERLSSTSHSHHKSIILDATDEAFVKINKRQSQLPKIGNYLHQPDSPQLYTAMSKAPDHGSTRFLTADSGPDSVMESLRWLDESDDLDLRLCLEDHQSSPKPGKKKRPAFPRHLSISKLSFGRPSSQISRPATKTMASPALSEQFVMPSLPSPSGHFRRRSRALSLMSPNKSQMPDDASATDAAPSHYQDPEARMKLRVYLASPHKFDEAIEFGFPSLYDVQGRESVQPRSWSRQETHDRTTQSAGDDAGSLISDPTSPVETISPRTPQSPEHQSGERSPRLHHEGSFSNKVDYAQAPASSREMTLRMTLTRPDLRADEEQMYGWQKPSSAKAHAHDGLAQPRTYVRAANSKDSISIERQFAAFDADDAGGDSSVVKRIWNRVRRS
ncbi:hypothetical protein BBK36DRAFT_1118301 [Trichoderma citrinoviride]|uniref:Mucin n=1 Tax=Trichoderma citrinoviride TaxID=58853 RepID=A0A2T4BCM4_9HYPO|nr:hypothetical protein BBK36DRAFT_1118301 [Trichoderma citrinoviride]PTB67028.1 hypothetical protein BBK36DRAFT_1118301 [Trichoderma citrinoviride]